MKEKLPRILLTLAGVTLLMGWGALGFGISGGMSWGEVFQSSFLWLCLGSSAFMAVLSVGWAIVTVWRKYQNYL